MERAVLHRGRVLRELGRLQETLDIFLKLTKNDPSAEYYMELARTYNALGKWKEAQNAYKRVLEIHINYPDAYRELVSVKTPF